MPTERFWNPNSKRYEERETGEAITETGRKRLRQLEGEKSQEEVEKEGGLAAAAARARKKREAEKEKGGKKTSSYKSRFRKMFREDYA